MIEQRKENLTLEAAIRHHIERVLHMTDYNRSQAARILGLPLSTLRSKMKKLAIDVKEEKDTGCSDPAAGDRSSVGVSH